MAEYFVSPPTSVTGTLHFVPTNLSAFEFATTEDAQNVLLWVGGLYDTYLSTTYPIDIAKALPPSWSLILASLSSSGLQFGVSSIKQDVEDIAKILTYLKTKKTGKVVIMGHSTGCQDVILYITGPQASEQPKIDGIIIQGPVSDREAIGTFVPDEAARKEVNDTAIEWVKSGRGRDALPDRLTSPVFPGAAITAQRWYDLASPTPEHDGADDMFSSDLSDERLGMTFGSTPAGMSWLILYSGNDEAVPESIDKQGLVDKWSGIVKRAGGVVDEKHSGLIPGASHNLNGNDKSVVDDLVGRVAGFLATIDA